MAGDFRDAEYLMLILRKQIPETEWENYDRYCTELLKEMERKRKDAVKQVLEEREEWLEASQKAAGGIPVIDFFNRKMMETEDGIFRQFIREQLVAEDDWTEGMEWERDWYLHLEKMCRLYSLADSFIYGGSCIKERLFAYLSEEGQMTVMEGWAAAYYPSDVEDLMNKLLNMIDAADRLDGRENEEDAMEQTVRICRSLDECGWAEEEYMASHRDDIVNSLEKLAGRAITADDVDRYYGWFETNMQDC